MTSMGRPSTLPSPWQELALSFGGVDVLSTRLQVDPRTIRRWAAGDRIPHAIVRKSVDALARSRGVEPPFGF